VPAHPKRLIGGGRGGPVDYSGIFSSKLQAVSFSIAWRADRGQRRAPGNIENLASPSNGLRIPRKEPNFENLFDYIALSGALLLYFFGHNLPGVPFENAVPRKVSPMGPTIKLLAHMELRSRRWANPLTL
jgi:hypothetical protein